MPQGHRPSLRTMETLKVMDRENNGEDNTSHTTPNMDNDIPLMLCVVTS
jgi:hypothetical protein